MYKRVSKGRSIGRSSGLLSRFGILLLSIIGSLNIAGAQSIPMVQSSGSTGTSAIESASSDLSYRFEVGRQLVYRLHYKSESTSYLQSLMQSSSADGTTTSGEAIKFRFDGEMLFTVLEKEKETAKVSFKFSKSSVGLSHQNQPLSYVQVNLAKIMRQVIFGTVDMKGRILSLTMPAGTDPISHSIIRSLLGVNQFVLADSATQSSNEWTVKEEDTNGTYIATYRSDSSQSNSDIAAFTKQKQRYEKTHKPVTPHEREETPGILPSGSYKARFNKREGHLVSLYGSEKQEVRTRKAQIALSNFETFAELTSQRKVAQVTVSQQLRALKMINKTIKPVTLSYMKPREETERELRIKQLGTSKLPALLAELKKLSASKEKVNKTPIYQKFKALFYLYPERCYDVKKLLAAADPKSDLVQIVMGAMGAVGHSQAQSVFRDLITLRQKEVAFSAMAISLLGDSPSPTVASVDFLRNIVQTSSNVDISSTAILTLGAIARTLSEKNRSQANELVRWIMSDSWINSSAVNLRLRLIALGNAGNEISLPLIRQYSADSSVQLRAAAARSLRWIPSEEANKILINLLTKDSEQKVRIEAAGALRYRQMTTENFKVHKEIFTTDKETKVRLVTLLNLWQSREEYPEVVQLIKDAAADDPSADVKEVAKKIIEDNETEFSSTN
jgi:hypothetical protein